MVAGDKELVAVMQPIDVLDGGRTIRFLLPAVTAGACQHEIPDAVDGRATDQWPRRPREDMVDVTCPIGAAGDLDSCEAVEAVALLVAVQRRPSAGDVRAPPRDDERLGDRFELHGEEMPRQIEFPCGLDQTPPSFDFIAQIGDAGIRDERSDLFGESDATIGLAFVDEEPLADLTCRRREKRRSRC